VNVGQELLDGGFKAGDVVIASSGQSVALHVKGRDPVKIRALVEFLQKRTWAGVVFTARGAGAAHEGAVAGTFRTLCSRFRGPRRAIATACKAQIT
jgi:hypothetical protein